MTEPWILSTLGVATKHCAPGEEDQMKACRTTYNPMLFAVVNTESEATYRRLFSAAKTVATDLFQADWSTAVRQYHSDWHAGGNNARVAEFPASIRVGDWAHFVGATARPREATIARLSDPDAKRRAAWRAGVFHTTRQRLERDENIDYIRSWIYSMRVQPTALLFTYMAHYFFAALDRKGEGEAVTFLKKQYFRKLPKVEAEAAHGVVSWPGDPTFIWTADWWAGVGRAQPGSAGASQAQESWHRHDLQGYVKTMRRAPRSPGPRAAGSAGAIVEEIARAACDVLVPAPDGQRSFDIESQPVPARMTR